MCRKTLFAVAGHPIRHSLSPSMFNRLFREMEMKAHYLRLSASNADEAVATAKSIGIQGLNITSPIKEEIIPLLDTVDIHARKIQAANCLVSERQQYRGYNTDFIGAVHALKKNGADPRNKRIAVLGAGGAARAAVYGFRRARAQRITLLNRTSERARQVSSRLGCEHAPIEHTKKVLAECDILVSCIPSHKRIINPDHIHNNLMVMDASYKNSFLLEDAKIRGCRAINGLSWLVYQAIPAFRLFTGRNIPKNLIRIIEESRWQGAATKKNNIALTGFMGAGKTEVGKILAERIGYSFADTDSLIQKIAGLTVSEIFHNRGESSFRALESAVIQKMIPDSHGYVFSLGGGALLDRENARLVKERCHIVWIWASVRTIQNRVYSLQRPLLPADRSLEQIERMLEERIPLYSEVCDFVINNELHDAVETADRIKYEMDKAFEN